MTKLIEKLDMSATPGGRNYTVSWGVFNLVESLLKSPHQGLLIITWKTVDLLNLWDKGRGSVVETCLACLKLWVISTAPIKQGDKKTSFTNTHLIRNYRLWGSEKFGEFIECHSQIVTERGLKSSYTWLESSWADWHPLLSITYVKASQI